MKDYVTSETAGNKGQLLCLYSTTCLYFEVLIMFIWDASMLKEDRGVYRGIKAGVEGGGGQRLRGYTPSTMATVKEVESAY